MTHSATGDWTFAAIGILYVMSFLVYALGYVSKRDSAAACVFTTAWLTWWSALYATWWSVACAVCATMFFIWQWYRSGKAT